MSDIAIRAENLGKRYRIGQREPYRTFRDAIVTAAKAPLHRLRRNGQGQDDPRQFWALKDVSFEIKQGEAVGIIGRNGAGKSTLLKILSEITEPTTGSAEIRGRVSSLLEVGTGFHPELTGRENIYLNGAILGMSRAEINRKFDEIVAFSEIEEYLDTPVKRYSSGMRVRLAFSVAAHLEPEVLIIDEVLAVGDVGFQKKCLGKMDEVARQGRAILIVSHNMSAIRALCRRAILLRHGHNVFDGEVEPAIRHYLSYLQDSVEQAFEDNPERHGSGAVRMTDVYVLDESGERAANLIAGRPATVVIAYENPGGAAQAAAKITFYNHLGVAVTTCNTRSTSEGLVNLSREGVIKCFLPRLPFPVGHYRLSPQLKAAGHEIADAMPNAAVFDVQVSDFFVGASSSIGSCACLVDHEWGSE